MNRKRTLISRWAGGGALFGCVFPIVALLTAASDMTIESIMSAHASQPVIWIVDLAPLILAGAGAVIGLQHSRVDAALVATDQRVRDRTAELTGAYRKLEDLMASKDQFVAMVSHEVRNPLTVVMGFAEELRLNAFRFSQSEVADVAGLIADQSMEISNIIEDILVAARSDMSSLSIAVENIDLSDQAEAVVRTSVFAAEVRDAIALKTSPTQVSADPARVRQIVRNLLSNAVRYGGDGISVVVAEGGGTSTVSVYDDGPGIPLADRGGVFEAYVQAANSRKVSGSVGLGLHVSRTLARAMGGDLAYRYEDGRSVFALTLPSVVTNHHSDRDTQTVAL